MRLLGGCRRPVARLTSAGRTRWVDSVELPVERPAPAPRGHVPAPVLRELTRLDEALRRALPPTLWTTAGPARVDGRSGLAWTRLRVVNPPFVDDPRFAERLLAASAARVYTHRPRQLPSRHFLCRHVWERNTYHLIWDLIPQLRLAELRGATRALISQRLADDPRFSRLVLQNPGFAHFDFVTHDDDLRVGQVVAAQAGWASRETADWLVERLAPRSSADGRRLFVMRSEQHGRHFLDRQQVSALAERHGFEVVVPEQLPFDRQMELFASARIVVGAHGAALANVVFRGHRPLTIVEIVPEQMRHPFYFNLARGLGAEYRAVAARLAPTTGPWRRAPIELETGRLEEALTALP